MRIQFGKTITELAEKDDAIYLLSGDIGFGIFDEFREKFPNRFFNVGIREQAMISMAAGMALEELKPYVYTITPFLVDRAFEQVKLGLNQQKANVKLVGYADYPDLGPTHKELVDQQIMERFRNIHSYFPKNSSETKEAILESYGHKKPTFLSLKNADKIRS